MQKSHDIICLRTQVMATRKYGLSAFQEQLSASEEEVVDELDESDQSSSEDIVNAGDSREGKAKATSGTGNGSRILVQTAFDAYFTHNKPGRVKTSSNVFSELVLPLSAEEYDNAIRKSGKGLPMQASILSDENRTALFSRLICELDEGFNILCYGFGSKRQILNQFAMDCCSECGHVVVVNGFNPDTNVKDILNTIENIADFQDLDVTATTVEKQARRIYDFFSTSETELYLIIHNIDAAPLRPPKAKSILSLLAHNPCIHLIASIDHINAPLLWSLSESFSRKPQRGQTNNTPSRGYAWLWHDLTTLAPYDFELTFADRTSLSGAHSISTRRKVDALGAQNAHTMSETAASHILASVTKKAQKLFILLGKKQLEAAENAGEGASKQFGLAYDVLFSEARDNFIATSDTALRALLGEFRDHNLVVSSEAGASGGEVLWIPMRKERLINVLQTLQSP